MSSTLFCAHCGAANAANASACFACHRLLVQPDSLAADEALDKRMVSGRYQLSGLLGSGGFGAVYQAIDTKMHNKQVAVKEVHLQGLTAQEASEATEAFHREAQLLAGLRHPNLPDIYDEFEENGCCYLVMELIDGITLEEYASQHPAQRLPFEEVVSLGLALCEVLEYLHTRRPPVIFRDLKPGNVMRSPVGHLSLIDFGIARHFKPGQSKDTVPLGSPGYASPEQYGRAQTDQRADIYSLGALLHALVTGIDPSIAPFHFAPLALLTGEGVDELDRLIQRMVSIQVGQRPDRIKVVRAELEHIRDLRNGLQRVYAAQTPPKPAQPQTPKTAHGKKGKPGAATKQPVSVAVTGPQIQMQQSPKVVSGSKRGAGPLKVRRRRFLWIVGSFLVVGGGMGLLIKNQVDNQSNQQDAAGDSASIYHAVLSPDGTLVAVDTYGDKVFVRNVRSNEVFTLPQKVQYTVALAWSPDSTRLAVMTEADGVQIWDIRRKSIVLTYRGYSEDFGDIAVAWSPDGKQMATVFNQHLHFWNPANGKLITHVELTESTTSDNLVELLGISWSGDSQQLAVSLNKSSKAKTNTTQFSVYLYDQNGKQVGLRDLPATTNGSDHLPAIWSPATPYLATYQDDVLWLMHTEDQTKDQRIEHLFSDIQTMNWSPDGHKLGMSPYYGKIAIWDIESKTPAFYPQTEVDVKVMGWLPDSRQIRYISDQGIETIQID